MTRADEMQQLWLDHRRTGDRRMRDQLIDTYAPLVRYVAGRLGSGLSGRVDETDLVSWGRRGLIGAIEDYDPARDVKFDVYAMARIKREILSGLRSTDWGAGDEGGGDEGAGGAGVREPRRPRPHAPSAEDVIDPAA